MDTEFLEKITEADWDRMAAVSGIDRVELKRKIKEGLQHYEPSDPPQLTITRPPVEEFSTAQPKPFEFELGLSEIVALKIHIVVHIRSAEDFRIEFRRTILLFSIEVDTHEIIFDQDHLKETFRTDIPLICEGSISVGWRFVGKQLCSTLAGHFSAFGLPPLKIDTDLLCITLP